MWDGTWHESIDVDLLQGIEVNTHNVIAIHNHCERLAVIGLYDRE